MRRSSINTLLREAEKRLEKIEARTSKTRITLWTPWASISEGDQPIATGFMRDPDQPRLNAEQIEQYREDFKTLTGQQ